MKGSKPLWVLIWILITAYPFSAPAEPLTLAVANSTCNLFHALSSHYSPQHPITILCKSSGRLAKGLDGDAIHADYYLSANKKWMDFMVSQQLVTPATRHIPWSNRLVVASSQKDRIELNTLEDLDSPKIHTILIGDPSTAPFGRYAKQALKQSGIWNQVRAKVITRKHITLLADDLAESSEGTVGILFSTNLSKHHKEIHSISAERHTPIRYHGAILTQSRNKSEAKRFITFLQSQTAQAVMTKFGFIPLHPESP
ncbi:molybdate ABC transporter substrate-binding protein [Magnetococcus sp. PR-3]|uniref:molybdate ABC transporter substrate-binding protein n=1 Tax=Magnetococcus sp. PR-3 TaxID=3120355 RepID=UPI002FCE5AF9